MCWSRIPPLLPVFLRSSRIHISYICFVANTGRVYTCVGLTLFPTDVAVKCRTFTLCSWSITASYDSRTPEGESPSPFTYQSGGLPVTDYLHPAVAVSLLLCVHAGHRKCQYLLFFTYQIAFSLFLTHSKTCIDVSVVATLVEGSFFLFFLFFSIFFHFDDRSCKIQ